MKVSRLSAATGFEVNPSFSPDGTQVVYEWERDGSRHLYVKVVGPGDPVPLTSGTGTEYGPVWSPDGKWIAFIGRQQASWGIYVIAPVGGTARKVTDIAGIAIATLNRPYRHLDWTRDSRHVIASVFGRAPIWEALLLISIDNGEKTWLTNSTGDAMSGDREPAVSPDGRTVAFARGAVSSERLYLLPLTTDLRPEGPPRPIETAGQARGPAWLANKELILTALDPTVITGLALSWMDLGSGKPPQRLIALGSGVATPAVSRPGTLAYCAIGGEGTIWRQDINVHGEPVSPSVKINSAATIQLDAQYSPDGSRIAFSSERSGTREVWNCASDGSPCLQVTRIGHRSADTPRWSPDGTQIVFGSLTGAIWDVYVVDANGGAARKLTQDGPHGGYPSWSRDGKWIYYSSVDTGKHVIWKLPAAGGKATQVTRDKGRNLMESVDSKFLYYNEEAKLFRSAADGSNETELLSDLSWWSFVVARDRIYYIHEDSQGVNEIRQLSLSSGENSRVVQINKPLSSGLSLSSDGRSLLYAEMQRRGNLMIAEELR
jgi:Tol biopolymer transport system component